MSFSQISISEKNSSMSSTRIRMHVCASKDHANRGQQPTPSCSLLDRAQRTDRVRSTFRDVDLIWELRRIDSAEGWPCPIRGLNQGGIDNGENAVAEGGRGNQRVISPPLIQPPPEAIRTPDRENVCPAHSSVSEWSIGIHTSVHPSFSLPSRSVSI